MEKIKEKKWGWEGKERIEGEVKWKKLSRGREGEEWWQFTAPIPSPWEGREGEGWVSSRREGKITQTNWKLETGFSFLLPLPADAASGGGQFVQHLTGKIVRRPNWVVPPRNWIRQASLAWVGMYWGWSDQINLSDQGFISKDSIMESPMETLHDLSLNIWPITTSKGKWSRGVGQPDKWDPFGRTLSGPPAPWSPGEPKARNICTIQRQESLGAGLLGGGSNSGICLICFWEGSPPNKNSAL